MKEKPFSRKEIADWLRAIGEKKETQARLDVLEMAMEFAFRRGALKVLQDIGRRVSDLNETYDEDTF